MWTHILSLAVAAALARTAAAQPASPSDYEVLIGEDLEGSGFVIRHQGQLWGVTSIHQFDGRVPARLGRLEGEPAEILLRREGVRRQDDVQAVPLQDQTLTLPFLAYESDFALADDASLVVLGPAGETVPATLRATGGYRSSEGPRKLTAHTATAFAASGGSGAPILAATTGAVVGVLLAADDGEKARRVEFETLCLPGAQAPTERAAPVTFAAVAGRWTLDLAYAHEIWKAERGEAYDPAEWARLTKDPDTVDEVRLDEKSVSFYERGVKNIGYPVLGWTVENGVVWVKARHFLGSELKWGFVVQGDRLKILDRDGTWRWLSAFHRAEPPARRSPNAGGLRIAAVVVLALGACLIAWLVGFLAKRRRPPPS